MTEFDALVFPFDVDFNAKWHVAKPNGPFAGLRGGSTETREVVLPHDAMRDTTRSPDAPLGGASGYFPSSSWSYSRTLFAPIHWQGQYLALEIDGAASKARVYVNGNLVANRPNGYSRFFAEISNYLDFGAENEIRIEVRTHLDSRWYTGSGLYRGVRLIGAGALKFANDGTFLTTTHLTEELATLLLCAEITNDSNQIRKAKFEVIISQADGNDVVQQSRSLTVLPSETINVRQTIYLKQPQAWSTENPYLYDVRCVIEEGEEIVASNSSKAGIRILRLDPLRGLQVNGVETKLRGACIHLDNGPLGMVTALDVELRRVNKLKEAGFNAIRISHNPAGQALLTACDMAGLLVINEAFDIWTREKSEYDYAHDFPEWWERDLESMVKGSRNHPSVIMYSIGNEVLEIGLSSGATLNRRLAETVRSFDASRPITNGIQTLFAIDLAKLLGTTGGLNSFMGTAGQNPNADGIASGMNRIATSDLVSKAIEEVCSDIDVTGYNYADARYLLDVEKYPNRVIMGSETFPTQIASNWKLVQMHPQIIGDFTWTGWDYLGEVGIGAPAYLDDGATEGAFEREFPYLTAYCGDIDITGQRRPVSYYREIIFGLRQEPFIAVHRPNRREHTRVSQNAWQWTDSLNSWSWPEFEDQTVTVDVYSPSDEVELFLNGQSLGRKQVGAVQANVATFHIAYKPGEITAVALTKGVEISRTSLKNPVGEARLNLSIEKPVEEFETGSYAFVNISIADAHGEIFTNLQETVELIVSGPGELSGFGSGAPSSTETFDSDRHQTFDGRALAIIKILGSGRIEIEASSELCAAKTFIQVQGGV